jgi:hypothetical protein
MREVRFSSTLLILSEGRRHVILDIHGVPAPNLASPRNLRRKRKRLAVRDVQAFPHPGKRMLLLLDPWARDTDNDY